MLRILTKNAYKTHTVTSTTLHPLIISQKYMIGMQSKSQKVRHCFTVQRLLRQCTDFYKITNLLQQNKQIILKGCPTPILQFFNQFYLDPKHRKKSKQIVQMYSIIDEFKNEELNLYELTLKLKIYSKLQIYHFSTQIDQFIKTKLEPMKNEIRRRVAEINEKVEKNKNKIAMFKDMTIDFTKDIQQVHKTKQYLFKVDLIDAFCVFMSFDSISDSNFVLEIIDKQFEEIRPDMVLKKLYIMLVIKIANTPWATLTKYENIIKVYTYMRFNLQHILNINESINFFTSLSALKLHKVGYKTMPIMIQHLLHHYRSLYENNMILRGDIKKQNLQRKKQQYMLKNLDILQIINNFSSFPQNYQTETLNMFLGQVINKSYITTHYLINLPFNKIKQDQIDIIVDKLIKYYQHAFFQDSVYFCNKSFRNNSVLLHPRMLKSLSIKIQQNLKKINKLPTDFARYIGISRLLWEKDIMIKKPGSNKLSKMDEIASQLYFEYKERFKSYSYLNQLSLINTIILLQFLDSANHHQQADFVEQRLLEQQQKRLQKDIFNYYYFKIYHAMEWHCKTNNKRTISILCKLLEQTIKSFEKFQNPDLLIEIKIKIALFILSYRDKQNQQIKKPLQNIAMGFLNQLTRDQQVLLVEYYNLFEGHTQQLLINLNKFLLKTRATNLRNAISFINSVRLKWIKDTYGLVNSILSDYCQNVNLKKQIQEISKQPNNLKNSLQLFEVNATIKILMNFKDQPIIANFILNLSKEYLLNLFPLPNTGRNIKILDTYNYRLALEFLTNSWLILMQEQRKKYPIGQLFLQDHPVAIKIHDILQILYISITTTKKQKPTNQKQHYNFDTKQIHFYFLTQFLYLNNLLEPYFPQTIFPKSYYKKKILEEIKIDVGLDAYIRTKTKIISKYSEVYLLILNMFCLGQIPLSKKEISQLVSTIKVGIDSNWLYPHKIITILGDSDIINLYQDSKCQPMENDKTQQISSLKEFQQQEGLIEQQQENVPESFGQIPIGQKFLEIIIPIICKSIQKIRGVMGVEISLKLLNYILTILTKSKQGLLIIEDIHNKTNKSQKSSAILNSIMIISQQLLKNKLHIYDLVKFLYLIKNLKYTLDKNSIQIIENFVDKFIEKQFKKNSNIQIKEFLLLELYEALQSLDKNILKNSPSFTTLWNYTEYILEQKAKQSKNDDTLSVDITQYLWFMIRYERITKQNTFLFKTMEIFVKTMQEEIKGKSIKIWKYILSVNELQKFRNTISRHIDLHQIKIKISQDTYQSKDFEQYANSTKCNYIPYESNKSVLLQVDYINNNTNQAVIIMKQYLSTSEILQKLLIKAQFEAQLYQLCTKEKITVRVFDEQTKKLI